MKNTLKWRLGKLPTSVEVQDLVKADLITKEEAREILFNSETEEEVDKKSLESEIKFLRELVTKLSNKSTIIETVRTIQPTYIAQPWYTPYVTWCSGGAGSSTTCYATANGSTTGSGSTDGAIANCFNSGCNGIGWDNTGDFTSIKTF
jgi:hypothetical protein